MWWFGDNYILSWIQDTYIIFNGKKNLIQFYEYISDVSFLGKYVFYYDVN